MKKILVIDDEISIVKVMKLVLEKRGYEVIDCFGPEEAIFKLKTENFDLMITDLRLNHRVDGLDLVDRAKLLKPKLPIIVMTAYSSVSIAVKAMKLGVYDFITKPFKMDNFLEVIENCLENNDTSSQKIEKSSSKVKLHFGSLLGESKEMHKVYSLIKKVAKTNTSVIIEGESGSEKVLVAKAIHQASSRKKQKFNKVNCASTVDSSIDKEVHGLDQSGKKQFSTIFEEAQKGTIFLDQVDKMSEKLQSSILRILENKQNSKDTEELDFRLISGTNQSLAALSTNDNFCKDLYYQLSVVQIKLPSLRQRVEDIPMLAKYYCEQESQNIGHEVTLSPDALECLIHYSWPGNIKELTNVISSAALISDSGLITCSELPPNISDLERDMLETVKNVTEERSLKHFLREKEKAFITAILKKTNGNRVKAAKMLGISRASLYRKLDNEPRTGS